MQEEGNKNDEEEEKNKEKDIEEVHRISVEESDKEK